MSVTEKLQTYPSLSQLTVFGSGERWNNIGGSGERWNNIGVLQLTNATDDFKLSSFFRVN